MFKLTFILCSLLLVILAEDLPCGGSLGKKIIEELHSTGVLKLNGTTVHNLDVQGSLIATSAELGELQVMGEANLRESRITSDCAIFGYLRAQDTTFEGVLTLNANKAFFTHCKLNSIIIRREEGFKGKQIIELKQGCIVDGPIAFESGKGEVHLYGGKLNGSITGGKLIRKN